MTRTWKAAVAGAIAVVAVAGVAYLAGSRDSETAGPVSRGQEPAPSRSGAMTARPANVPGNADPSAGPRLEPGPATTPGESPDAKAAPPAAPPTPLAKPSASDVAHRAALSDPRNPERWVDYAKALDSDGKPDLAVAALRRALHLGVDFEGRREVMRLVREYEDYLRDAGQKSGGTRRAAPTIPRKPDHSRSR